MSSIRPWEEFSVHIDGPVPVPVTSLMVSDSPRLAGENVEHTRALAEAEVDLPPILVHRPSMRVIDGMHRLLAAGLRGDREILAQFFDGDADAAFVLSVRANTTHGLPLSYDERVAAASRILAAHTEWSDRAVAAAAGLAPRTVGALRRCATDDDEQLHSRIGRDGRVRPLSTAAGRRLAGELIERDPSASLRTIAAATGISPGTVRDVRRRISQGEDPVPSTQREPRDLPAETRPGAVSQVPPHPLGADRPVADPRALLTVLQDDPSLKYSESGKALLRMLSINVLNVPAFMRWVKTVPEHCVPTIIGLTRMCADNWLDCVKKLENIVLQEGA